MADKPLGATHYADGMTNRTYYRFDGSVWKWWAASSREWIRCSPNNPASAVTPLPPSEQSQCCGTTCDKRNVAEYIVRLEAVAEAARMVAYGVLAHNITGDTLRRTLGELPHD